MRERYPYCLLPALWEAMTAPAHKNKVICCAFEARAEPHSGYHKKTKQWRCGYPNKRQAKLYAAVSTPAKPEATSGVGYVTDSQRAHPMAQQVC